MRNHYRKIGERDAHLTAEKVKNTHLGLSMQHETLLAVYDRFWVDFRKMVDSGLREPSTLRKYRLVYRHLNDFIRKRYRQEDVALKEIAPAFITDFELFLRTERGCRQNTVWICVESVIRLLDIPRRIMEKYEGLAENGLVFPVPDRRCLDHHIRKIARQCGITKPVS